MGITLEEISQNLHYLIIVYNSTRTKDLEQMTKKNVSCTISIVYCVIMAIRYVRVKN